MGNYTNHFPTSKTQQILIYLLSLILVLVRNRHVQPVINSGNQNEINQVSFDGFKPIIKYIGL